MVVAGPSESSAMAAGSCTGSPYRRSMVVRGSMAVIWTWTGPAGRGSGSATRLTPSASGAGTATSIVVAPLVSRSPVTGEKSPSRCVTVSSDSGAAACASSVEPTAWPKGVIQAVVGSPSVADQPAADVAPVRRALACVPVMPSSPASTASVARWSSRTVTVGVKACSAGTVISRTMAASGSERQRSVGRVRRRVST